ncbi:hypothetical protein ACVIGB_005274 [Bradyrhizobium sp. USDA 4341]
MLSAIFVFRSSRIVKCIRASWAGPYERFGARRWRRAALETSSSLTYPSTRILGWWCKRSVEINEAERRLADPWRQRVPK